MIEIIADGRLRELVTWHFRVWHPYAGSQQLWDDTHAALTELLALRAEVERLRAVERLARKLQETGYHCGCHDCWVGTYGVGVRVGCLHGDLHAALDATKKEPGT